MGAALSGSSPAIAPTDVVRITGGRPLKGEITLRGAKNTVSKDMVAALLSAEPSTLTNISLIEDVEIMTGMLGALGAAVERDGHTLTINPKNLKLPPAQELLPFGKKSRIPPLVCGPMLARLGEAIIPMPGGCNIGLRPINFHLQALKELGAQIEERDEHFYLKAKRLVGAKIHLDYPSVGATEQVLLASVLAEGITELSNAAVEPEIIDLIAVLQKMGAIIAVNTDRVITINGVEILHGYKHTAMPDRLEAASWACAAVATNGRIFVRGARQLDLMTFLNKLRQVGGEFAVTDEGIEFFRAAGELRSISLETDVHPGFATDYQQPFVVLLTQAKGSSVVHETVYENRFGYIEALNQMGAQIQLYPQCLGSKECRFAGLNHLHSATVTGPTPLHGAEITVPDLRAGFSYVIAALTAQGPSTLNGYRTLYRGYENLTEKLVSLGADIREES
ncbi:MAG TPA: UDP-N-acetylglucosamine 1-carboxyvinyltransferase [Candidatus Saccharimonadales bacterium]|nr:UDP-N-acetylglucosamine 1-carboxyvinyltransferase [Candidatus Saccharimonadales bacterium]